MVRNYMEQVVDEELKNFLKDYKVQNENFCTCEKCIEDLKCITLNNLKPAYFSTEYGGICLKLDNLKRQYLIDLTSELTKAAIIVSENKRHSISTD